MFESASSVGDHCLLLFDHGSAAGVKQNRAMEAFFPEQPLIGAALLVVEKKIYGWG